MPEERLREALAGVAQWIECQAFEPESRQFDSQSGHTPGLQAGSPVGGVGEATTLLFLSLSPSLPPLCLKING